MSDKKLLELAAKAVPSEIKELHGHLVKEMPAGGVSGWNPLSDDGDALRLSVALGMSVVITKELGITDARVSDKTGWITEQHWDNTGAATRRAIVRVAAEIGKAKP